MLCNNSAMLGLELALDSRQTFLPRTAPHVRQINILAGLDVLTNLQHSATWKSYTFPAIHFHWVKISETLTKRKRMFVCQSFVSTFCTRLLQVPNSLTSRRTVQILRSTTLCFSFSLRPLDTKHSCHQTTLKLKKSTQFYFVISTICKSPCTTILLLSQTRYPTCLMEVIQWAFTNWELKLKSSMCHITVLRRLTFSTCCSGGDGFFLACFWRRLWWWGWWSQWFSDPQHAWFG